MNKQINEKIDVRPERNKKVKDLLSIVEDEMIDEANQEVKELVKLKLEELNSARKTVKVLEKKMKELLETDIMDLELDDYDY
jgi:hypothetical protein